jgi:formamidopyrimidine-DNA glycosylase
MPELPDVEAMRRYLLGRGLVGRKFTGAVLDWPRAVQGSSLEDLVLGILHKNVQDVARRGKYLILRLDDGQSLVFHMRMTGSLLLERSSTPRHRMTRNFFPLDDDWHLLFVDPRKLGTVQLVGDEAAIAKNLGPEPLDDSFTPDVFMQRLERRKAPIKALLCEQSVIAGIGNIYADEILFYAAVHPLTPGGSVTPKQVTLMHTATVQILTQAIEKLEDLVSRGGPPTESAEGLGTLKVPRKAGTPCTKCGQPVQRLIVRGRGAYFCPNCQK